MPKIVPHLWFDKEAREAAAFYTSVFSNSRVVNISTIRGTPSGDCDIVAFELRGQPFAAISAGPLFKFNPSISFIVNFDPSREDETIDAAWNKLVDGGQVLMELGKYPFAERFGWLQDRYGLSWQLILNKPEGEDRPEIVPALLFVGDKCGKAEEAIGFYLSVFEDSKMGGVMKRPAGMEPEREGTVLFGAFKLLDLWFAAMDSALDHRFTFNEAVSFMVNCETQAEIDDYWAKLSAVPEAEACGWLKDKYGVSWQIVPAAMDEMLSRGSREQVERVTQAFLKMKKFVIAELEKAYRAG